LLEAVVADARTQGQALTGRIVCTDRNIPVRHLYANRGFTADGQGLWTMPPRRNAAMVESPADA
jgi:hypothetical protein